MNTCSAEAVSRAVRLGVVTLFAATLLGGGATALAANGDANAAPPTAQAGVKPAPAGTPVLVPNPHAQVPPSRPVNPRTHLPVGMMPKAPSGQRPTAAATGATLNSSAPAGFT